MKCLYYLAPTLDSTRSISNDLHAVGVSDWYIHVVSRDEAGLKKEHIHSSNYIETYDFVRTGLLGASIGFLVGLGAAFVLSATKAFGTNVTLLPHLAVIFVAVLFGARIVRVADGLHLTIEDVRDACVREDPCRIVEQIGRAHAQPSSCLPLKRLART